MLTEHFTYVSSSEVGPTVSLYRGRTDLVSYRPGAQIWISDSKVCTRLAILLGLQEVEIGFSYSKRARIRSKKTSGRQKQTGQISRPLGALGTQGPYDYRVGDGGPH